MKNEEIEIKLKYKNKLKIISLLKNLGAKFKERYELHDVYFSFHNTMSNDYELIRIREIGKIKELTFKGKCEDNAHIWKRIEITTKIDDAEKMSSILLNLGLKKIKENISFREIYFLGSLEIAFINFVKPEKISLIELEGREKQINFLLAKLKNLVEKAGEEIFKSFDKGQNSS